MSPSSSLEKLANYRSRNTRDSRDTFETAFMLYERQGLGRLGDEKWPFLEQLALAAVDVGRTDVARECCEQLAVQFPGSPRLHCLEGILEETVSPGNALQFYQRLLTEDPTNAAAWKRLASVFRRVGQTERAIKELQEYLDTFYTDIDGWLELSDIYATNNRYDFALRSLSHALLLAPQNPFYVLLAAETAYTMDDVTLALKYFLMVVDMMDSTGDKSVKDSEPNSITVRAWYGVQLSARRLREEPKLASQSASETPLAKDIPLLEDLATEMLGKAYATEGAVSATQ
ncbi:TPR-like protein [Vararia minispora EC-137]|uniref:TPR-like protein n=1 Tax=Vararia minispora EC-137 TaxID=1314806 RepID=A0ACB8QJP4_9AGAM|nr:TPR-like protein [Vararia minispora EC-137]